MKNPYHYGTPVEGAQFAGRERELDVLRSRMSDGINLVLMSPRRYGKTSLLRKATKTMQAEGAAVISVNVLGCLHTRALAEQLVTQVFRVPGGRWQKAKQALPAFLKRLRVRPSVTIADDGTPTFTLAPGVERADIDAMIGDVYAALAEQTPRRPAVLVLDEFQAIVDLDEHLPLLFKSLADEHPGVALVVAGSKQHLMDRLVNGPDAPLFGMAEHLALEPIPDDVMAKYLVRRAKAGGKKMEADAARRLIELVGPVPNDIQHLAYEAFDAARDQIDAATVDRALDLAVEHEANLHAERFEGLATGQRRVVARLAKAPTSEPFASGFAEATGLAAASSVGKALDALRSAGLVAKRSDEWVVADPFFAGWLRQTHS